MKKNITRVCILSLLLIIISTIIILLFGRTYNVKFVVGNKNIQEFTIDSGPGEVIILSKKIVGNEYIVKLKSKKPGKVSVSLNHGDYREEKMLYVHKSMIITDNNYFGASTCSEIIPISLSLVLLYILYILIKEYRKSKRENIYQYRNIAYLGIIIFISFFTLNNIISIFNYHGLFDTIGNTIGSLSFVSIILFPVAVITFILVTISNINLIRKEGLSLRNILGLFLGIFICISTLLPDWVYGILMKSQKIDIYNLNGPGPYIYSFVETLIYLNIAYLECILIGTIVVAIKSVRKKIEYNKDYIIILGCQIKKDGTLTPLLKGRVDKAIEFRNKQLKETGKDLVFIPSGGKGNDEIISEAEAMKKYLLEQGIDENNILIDSRSKNTYENIKYSYELIKKKNANIVFSTTNYHVLRAGLIATEQGLILDGIGSKTKAYFWINAFIREFIGTLYSEKKKHILVFILIVITIIIMIGITYVANNT
ncbi:MAG: YdcF family protein [Bacilli bacterium]|nr:YdcF family protein [Bacilli bacterium]